MKPQTIGRALGIGVRVAGRVAGQHLANSGQASGSTQSQPVRNKNVQGGNTPERPPLSAGNVAKGVGGFFRPFRRAGGIIWLEIMGAFFLLPVVAFSPTLWRMRANWAHGPDHATFLLTAGVVLVFLYLGISSFWRARRRARRN
jgi:hypothetical protein